MSVVLFRWYLWRVEEGEESRLWEERVELSLPL